MFSVKEKLVPVRVGWRLGLDTYGDCLRLDEKQACLLDDVASEEVQLDRETLDGA